MKRVVLRMSEPLAVLPLMRKQTGIISQIVSDVDVASPGGANGTAPDNASHPAAAAVSENTKRINVGDGNRPVLIRAAVGLPIVDGGAGAATKKYPDTSPDSHRIATVAHLKN